MKLNRFDDLTKALATAGSRRQALRAIGVALGGALGLGRFGIAFAACHPDGDHCAKDKDCCSGHCQKPKNGPGICVTPTTTTTVTGTILGFNSIFELGGFHEV